AIFPLAVQDEVGERLDVCGYGFAVDPKSRLLAPAGDSEIQGEADRLRDRELELDRIAEGIIGLFRDGDRRSIADLGGDLGSTVEGSTQPFVGRGQPKLFRIVWPAVRHVVLTATV